MTTPVVLLHGFTGAPASWDAVRALLGSDFEVSCPALAGHAGQSFAGIDGFHAELERLAALLPPQPGIVLGGYSLGARLALGLVVKNPRRFARAVLIGVHPGLAHEQERAERMGADARWAAVLRTLGLSAFLDRWTAQPLFASQRRLPAELLAQQRALRSVHDPQGLALALERFSLGRMPSYWPDLPALKTPLTLAAGELDGKFVDLARRAAGELENATLLIAPDAGHNLVLERPDLVARAIALGQEP